MLCGGVCVCVCVRVCRGVCVVCTGGVRKCTPCVVFERRVCVKWGVHAVCGVCVCGGCSRRV